MNILRLKEFSIIVTNIGRKIAPSLPGQAASFDFKALAIVFAGISFGLIGLIMAGSALFPEVAEQYKRHIPTVITGLILVAVATTIVGALGK
ncbi:MAG: hypothetical protein WA821_18590 [Anaerolineales bacterium]